MYYVYCPMRACRRKLLVGEFQLDGYVNFRCPRCKADSVLGTNPAEPNRPQAIVTTIDERPPSHAALAR